MQTNEPLICMRGLSKSFGHKQVLDAVDIDIAEGHMVFIIGQSGCGKSVLLKHMVGLLSPDTGDIWIEGQSLAGAPEKAWETVRKEIGMVFQGGALFDSLSVAENVSFFLSQHDNLSYDEKRKCAAVALKQVGLSGILDEKPAALSGGMRKRVAIARAIVSQPKIIFYDEPTTGLDPLTQQDIDTLISTLNGTLGTVTSIVVSHDMRAALTYSDKIAMLHDGHIVAYDTPEKMRQHTHPVVRAFIDSVSPVEVQP